MFQYRKRYLRVATMDDRDAIVSRLYIVFQYRKRYLRVATLRGNSDYIRVSLFQYRKRYLRVATLRGNSDYIRVSLFQYRKRYLRVATACLETRPQTGLKKQIGKPPRFFTGFPNYFGKRYSKTNGRQAFMPESMPLSAFTQKLENLGFQLSFIIAGFRNFCQTAIRFSKTAFSCLFAFGASYTGIFFRKKPSYF